MADILSNISIVLYVIAGVCLVITVLLWFAFDIPTVIGDLSGRTAKKSIAKMRENNERSGVKSFKSSKTNLERGKLTGVPETTGNINKQSTTSSTEEETGLLDDQAVQLSASEETALLNESEETALLSEVEETGLLVDDNETALLEETISYNIPVGGKHLEMIESVMMIHTSEVI